MTRTLWAAALALAVGCGGDSPSEPDANRLVFRGTVAPQEEDHHEFTVTSDGLLEAVLTWEEEAVELDLTLSEEIPPYNHVGEGIPAADEPRVTLTVAVRAVEHLITVSNFDDAPATYSLVVRHP